MAKPVILCVDDEKALLESIKQQLRRHMGAQCGVEMAESGEEALERFDELVDEQIEVPIVVSDHIMPGMKGTELLAHIHERRPDTLSVLLTGQADADAVGRAVNEARLYRYVAKPWDETDLALTLREALRRYFSEQQLAQQHLELQRLNDELTLTLDELQRYRAQLEAENVYLRDELKAEHDFENIIGHSAALKRTLDDVARVAPSDSTVLLIGESGTGKELFARAVHDRSRRRDRPLVKVNCAALPSNLIESELFGHEKGAFTGAVGRRAGRFELADGGTIFLDEIGEMPIELQGKLLRVLQEGELERLGGSHTIAVDVRVIAATNRDLEHAVTEGRFREDLYYRLNVFPVHPPPLRERRSDIATLAMHFADKHGGKVGKHFRAVAKQSLRELESYRWPGNVRELENVIERSVIVSEPPTLTLHGPLSDKNARVGSNARVDATDSEQPQTWREMEMRMIREAVAACDGVVGGKHGAARRLDIPASTLRERMQRYGMSKK
jgi:DNA-binding NtrC family response regulator